MLKTQTDLYNALVILNKKKPYSQITVDEICKEASIRRPTFYNHYKDKDDFAKVALTKYFLDKLKTNYSLDNLNFKDYFFTLLETFLYQIDIEKKKENYLKENAQEHIVYVIFHKTIFTLLRDKCNQNNEYNLDDISKEILVRSYSGIFINIVVYFINDDSLTVDDIIDRLGDLAYKIYFNKK